MELRSCIQSVPVVSSILTNTNNSKHNQLVCYGDQFIRTKKGAKTNGVKVKYASRFSRVRASAAVGSKPAETRTQDGEKDGDPIFVAGATGKVGSRTVRELLKLGFNVRAGVRSTQRAESLVKSVQQMKLDDGSQRNPAIEKLQLVECDLEKPEQIKAALGSASTVICCIGASEKEIFDVTGPYRIDFQATKNLIDAAAAAKAKHFILVTSLGTNKFGFPAAVLNLFWGVLCWKRKAEEALLASGIPYTIVRPGGMERPTDSFKETHNLTLATEDTLFGGLVSNLQVAELLAFMAKNPTLSYCKVLEVVAETTAPLTPFGDLLTKIPSKRAVPLQPKCYQEPETAPQPAPEPQPEPAPAPKTEIIATETPSESKPVATRPLSPYTAYEGLKPPVSPIPSAPGGSKAAIEAVSAPLTDSETTIKPEAVAITPEPAPVDAGLKTSRPLSPYTAYENLKPPTSPIPTPSGYQKKPSYSSATPEAAPEAAPEAVPESTTAVDTITKIEDGSDIKEDPPQVVTSSSRSPYYVYETLKPPTSPTPSPPSLSPPPIVPVTNGSPIASTPESTSVHTTVKPRPLSPYSMYESLKPPTSPTPSKPQ
ncbi:protein TIC 62, chloroplastic isoform X1 [Tanacetum coccineum]|uniref:Protein TIC 62, chloroplastic isoform X1 n=1 Tax=Tanacetum coccineum TaxID=301880 RepID=A0ABQ5G1X0_9ASTR